jgi:hypothetical protein
MNLDPKLPGHLVGGSLPGLAVLELQRLASVAMREPSEEFNLNLSNEQINACRYEAKRRIAGNPSGIDNTRGYVWAGLCGLRRTLLAGRTC